MRNGGIIACGVFHFRIKHNLRGSLAQVFRDDNDIRLLKFPVICVDPSRVKCYLYPGTRFQHTEDVVRSIVRLLITRGTKRNTDRHQQD